MHSLRILQDLIRYDSLENGCWITDNDKLENLSGLHNLNFIAGDFAVTLNDNLLHFGQMSIDSILGEFSVANNSRLPNFLGMESLKFIGDHFHVGSNFYMQNLLGLTSLNIIGGI